MANVLRALRTRRAAFAAWRELGYPVEYHPDGPWGFELVGAGVPADPLNGLRRRICALRWAVRRLARLIRAPARALSRQARREVFDLRVLAGYLLGGQRQAVWVEAVGEPDPEGGWLDLHVQKVRPWQTSEWFGRQRLDNSPSLARRVLRRIG